MLSGGDTKSRCFTRWKKNPSKNPSTEGERKPEKNSEKSSRVRGESLTDPRHRSSRKTSPLLRFDFILYPGLKKKPT